MGDAFILFLAFEHIDHHHTGQWLRKWLHEFNLFGDAVNDNGQGMQPLIDILSQECGLDIEKEFALCEEESNRKKMERG